MQDVVEKVAVLERARLALVGVADDDLGARRLRRHQAHAPGRKARATHAAQSGGFESLDRSLGSRPPPRSGGPRRGESPLVGGSAAGQRRTGRGIASVACSATAAEGVLVPRVEHSIQRRRRAITSTEADTSWTAKAARPRPPPAPPRARSTRQADSPPASRHGVTTDLDDRPGRGPSAEVRIEGGDALDPVQRNPELGRQRFETVRRQPPDLFLEAEQRPDDAMRFGAQREDSGCARGAFDLLSLTHRAAGLSGSRRRHEVDSRGPHDRAEPLRVTAMKKAGTDDALFERNLSETREDAETLEMTPALGGRPVEPDHQHGGAVSALVAYAVDRLSSPVPMRVARFTLDMFRGVPRPPLRVETRVTLASNGSRASGRSTTRTRRSPRRPPCACATDGLGELEAASRGPSRSAPRPCPSSSCGADSPNSPVYACDLVPGRAAVCGEPAITWARLRCWSDEETSPIVRLAAVADFASGTGNVMDYTKYSAINGPLRVDPARTTIRLDRHARRHYPLPGRYRPEHCLDPRCRGSDRPRERDAPARPSLTAHCEDLGRVLRKDTEPESVEQTEVVLRDRSDARETGITTCAMPPSRSRPPLPQAGPSQQSDESSERTVLVTAEPHQNPDQAGPTRSTVWVKN